MKKIINKFLKLQSKLVLLLSSLTFLSCGPFSSYNFNNSDGIYGSDTQNTKNQNGLYYKNYFDQKAQQLGVTNNPNDSILTDVDSYSSAYVDTNIEYKRSSGSWGDNPSSINFINNSFYPDHAFYLSSFHRPYYMSSWYDPYYYPYYSPFYSWNYFPYGRYGYRNYMYRPWFYMNYYRYSYGNPYYYGYQLYDPNTVAFMNGRRGSSDLDSFGFSSNRVNSNTVVNNNVGRNSGSKKSVDNDERNRRNINRLYYTINGNGLRSSYQARDYDNNVRNRDIDLGNGSNNVNNSSNSNSIKSSNSRNSNNFQLSRYGNGNRNLNYYNKSSNSGNPSGRSYTVPVRSNNSSMRRSTYSPSSSSIGRSSIRSSGSSGSTSSGTSSSRSRSPR